jgi:hypothetical protein
LSFFEKHQLLKNERLANMCGTEKFFLVFHTRSSVAMYKRGEALTTLTKESIEALHSTLLLLRLRWYALLVTNARLDAQLKKVQRQVDAIVDHYRLQEKETTLSKDLELDRMQLEIFSIKEELLRNLQDPISYRAHFGSMLEIYETGAEKFRIYEMQSVILGKISNLDSLFEMMKEMKFLIRYQRIG